MLNGAVAFMEEWDGEGVGSSGWMQPFCVRMGEVADVSETKK